MLATKKQLSSKINYDALADLFESDAPEGGKKAEKALPKPIVPTGLPKVGKKGAERGKGLTARRPPQRGFSLLNAKTDSGSQGGAGGGGGMGSAGRLSGGNFNLLDKTSAAGGKGLGSLDKLSGMGGLGGLGLLHSGALGGVGAARGGGIGRSRIFGSVGSGEKR
jgi:hypothetical protein